MTARCIANWKMHGSLQFAEDWAGEFMAEFSTPKPFVAVCPPLPFCAALRKLLPLSVLVGGQDVSAAAADGAHTGEVSGRMLADVGCALALVGHSERRARGETDADCAAKIRAAAAAGLNAVLCVGESAAVRKNGGTAAAGAAVKAQLAACLKGAGDAEMQNLTIAYEPVWAIGSGETPSADAVGEMRQAARETLMQLSPAFGGKIAVLYGGSVTPATAPALAAAADGFLVGGASLRAGDFAAVCLATEQQCKFF